MMFFQDARPTSGAEQPNNAWDIRRPQTLEKYTHNIANFRGDREPLDTKLHQPWAISPCVSIQVVAS